MLRNYFTIAIRNLLNRPAYAILNILGLSVGIGCCLVIALFVIDMYSWDTHHKNANNIYRVVCHQFDGTQVTKVASTPAALGPEIQSSIAEIENTTRLSFKVVKMSISEQEPVEERVMATDSSFLSMFTLPFIAGPKKAPLSNNSILLSEETAKRLYGDKSPIGEIITIQQMGALEVTGIFKELPYQSHLRINMIISFRWIEMTDPKTSDWGANAYYNYVLMRDKFDLNAVNKKINNRAHLYTPPSAETHEYKLQPLLSINSEQEYRNNPMGTIGSVLIIGFIIIGSIILALASLNYMNLSTARSVKRSMEVGIRKVMGAQRIQLINQFLIESLILCIISFLLGILWGDLGLAGFNALTGMHLSMEKFLDSAIIIWIILAVLTLTILSGGYPAFFLSRYLPVSVLKGRQGSDKSKRMRKTLVAIQFTLTSIFIIVSVIVTKQTRYLKGRDLGYNKENLYLFHTDRNENISVAAFKEELKKIPGITAISSTKNVPNSRITMTKVFDHAPDGEGGITSQELDIDHDFIPVMQVPLVAGKNFNPLANNDANVIINEEILTLLGWTPENAIGKTLFDFRDSLPKQVIGIARNFQMTNHRRKIEPMIISYSADNSEFVVRISGINPTETRSKIDEVVRQHSHGNNFDGMFLEESLTSSYGTERRVEGVLAFFTFLAILLGCSGLYALAAYEAEQRIKELGIRKILGATPKQLLALLSKSFLKPVAISIVAGMPIAWFLGNLWLKTYPYRTPWSPFIFITSAILILTIGAITVITQAIKASRLNPADALHYD